MLDTLDKIDNTNEQMKIHHNYRFEKMLENGNYVIVNNRNIFLIYPYQKQTEPLPNEIPAVPPQIQQAAAPASAAAPAQPSLAYIMSTISKLNKTFRIVQGSPTAAVAAEEGKELPPEAEPAADIPEIREKTEQTETASMPQLEAAVYIPETQPVAEPAFNPSQILQAEDPAAAVYEAQLETEPEVLPEAEAVAAVSETQPEEVTTALEIQLEEEAFATVSEQQPDTDPLDAAIEQQPEAVPVVAASERQIETETIAALPEAKAVKTVLAAKPKAQAKVADTLPRQGTNRECLVMELTVDVNPDGSISLTQPGAEAGELNINDIMSPGYGSIHKQVTNTGSSAPPYINFTAFNRLGLTIKNLTNLLDSDEDFELNIIDCNSKDNSWDYIQSLTDSRIKSKIHFDKNLGPIFAANFGLFRRRPDQYYFVMDSDTFIKTRNWIARFMEVFEAFPEVGLLGLMRDNPYPRYLPQIIPRVNGSISYLELKNADINAQMDFIPGQLQGLRPELIKEIGYWSEENGFGDAEISPRIVHYTNFKVGFITTVEIDMTQRINCDECRGKDFCNLSRSVNDCFSFSKKYNKNESFVEKNTWKFLQSFQELKDGTRTAYCASIHDPESTKNHLYNSDWAYENFNHYIINSN